MGPMTIAAGSRVYLDANAFIYAFEVPAAFPQVVALFRRLGRGEVSAVTSVLTLAELLVIPLRRGDAVLEAGYRRRIVSGPALTVLDVGRDVLVRAASIRAGTSRIKLPDAIHVATAQLSACDVLLTNDAKIGTVEGLPTVLIADLA